MPVRALAPTPDAQRPYEGPRAYARRHRLPRPTLRLVRTPAPQTAPAERLLLCCGQWWKITHIPLVVPCCNRLWLQEETP